jgi:hypothetical protein
VGTTRVEVNAGVGVKTGVVGKTGVVVEIGMGVKTGVVEKTGVCKNLGRIVEEHKAGENSRGGQRRKCLKMCIFAFRRQPLTATLSN